ncbi:Gfo/Idh/MocA family protein [Herbiconiux daphne]|uniref:Gfo/Idh/MocA family oxidoreductase n=1 Tax=Herbiconiux daphne TaxID=2970914 RepID=A0ABT2H4Z0_9MICO|nr:Gfo/Idh/MocA family oxidoreductase [Herbiconiux daphne]MCS5735007.1 Gfo/Idh/MocA family oxidoreductase [Herbiconiux daphne]
MTTNVSRFGATKLGSAFVGGGFMAEVHSRAARSAGGRLVGVSSSSLASADRAASRIGAEKAYDSFDELLSDPAVDVVHICTPNTTHASLAAAALRAGKHVICEKPLATSVADALALVELAALSDAVATVPFAYRFHPMVREARARVRSGASGRVLSVQGSYLQDWLLSSDDDDWRVDERLGGPSRAFADIGSHLCDLIEFVLDDRIAKLAALTRTVFGDRAHHKEITTEDIVSVVFETRAGVVGTLMISQLAPGRKNRLAIEIGATVESLVFDQENPEYLWIGKRVGSQLALRDEAALDPSAARYSVVPAGHAQGYQDAFNSFVSDTYCAVRGEEVDGLPVFADGLRAAVLTKAILDSNALGEWVSLPEHVTDLAGSSRSEEGIPA